MYEQGKHSQPVTELESVLGSSEGINEAREGRHGSVDKENPRSHGLRMVFLLLLLLSSWPASTADLNISETHILRKTELGS